MKPIRGLSAEPAGLSRFRVDSALSQTWDEFGSFEAGAAKRELTAALVQIQRGLCAYCENNLVLGDTQLEHFVPKGGPHSDPSRTLDHTNLLACCCGGTSASFGPSALAPDPARMLPPANGNLSCGQAKGDRASCDVVDPRRMSAQPSLFTVGVEGRLSPDIEGCAAAGLTTAVLERHVSVLGLNVRRLSNKREQVRAALADALVAFSLLAPVERDDALQKLANYYLLPDGCGLLRPFFTTSRSFFGPLAESILAGTRAWV